MVITSSVADKYKDLGTYTESSSRDSLSEDYSEARARSNSSVSSDGQFVLEEIANEPNEHIRFSTYVKYLFTKKFWKSKEAK